MREEVLSTCFSRLDLGYVLNMCQIGNCHDDPPAYAECMTKLTQQVGLENSNSGCAPY